MGIFDDKKYDSLDWISQAVEPIENKLNEVLGNLPEEYEVTSKDFFSIVKPYYSITLSVENIIDYMSKKDGNILPSEDLRVLSSYFKLETDGKILVDFENKTLNGNIRLVKTSFTIDETNLSRLLGSKGISMVSYLNIRDTECASRANDIMEILGGCEEGLRSRSPRSKKTILYRRISKIFNVNDWNIRDTELANKVGSWIVDYVEDGNLQAYGNICKLKVMTHGGKPIYSIEEL